MSVRYHGKKIAGVDAELPAQTGNSGKFLTTDGTNSSWKKITPSDASSLPDTTKYGATITVSLNTTDYKMTTTLKDQNGNTLGTAQVIDFPIESVVVNGSYDADNKKIVLTLQNGNTIDIPVGDLISGLQTEITADNMLNADLVDDATSTNKFVTASDKTTWNNSVRSVATGASNGTISVNTGGTSAEVSVYGLGTAAYTASTDYDAAGAASTAETNAKNYADGLASNYATAAQGSLADSALQSGDNVSELANDAGYLVMGDLTGFVTRTTAQTISGLKTFSADIVLSDTTSIKNTTSGVSYTMLYRDTSGIHVGTSTQALLLAGSGTHPSFNGNNLALLSEIPTVPTTLAALTGDVSISSPSAGQSLQYDADAGKWKNVSSSVSIGFDGITGSPEDNTALKNALDAKADSSSLATVATSGSYSDLSGTPTLGTMAAEAASDYTKTSGLATVATSGSYSDLSNTPTLGTAAAANSTDFATSTQGGKADTAVQPGDLATVATSGDYDDLTDKYVITYDSTNTRLVIAK